MKKTTAILCLLVIALFTTPPSGFAAKHEKSLRTLMQGNARFAAGTPQNPHRDSAHRQEITADQHPIAAVLSCSDSRVPPELVFDQGLGDLFVVRTAGEVLDAVALGSIEYAVEHLHVPLLIVMGHTGCGAVKAALSDKPSDGHIMSIVRSILPALQQSHTQLGDPLKNAVWANVAYVTKQLKYAQPILANEVQHHKLTIVGAVYDLNTGLVTVVPAEDL